MSHILDKICVEKRAHIEKQKAARPLEAIMDAAKGADTPRGFIKALQAKIAAGEYALIGEIKKASPSRGIIREDFHPATLARAYEAGGAACLSVLTDEPHFLGNDAFLGQAREACALPVLRKDFMLDAYQVYESRALGADCILLIMAALDDAKAAELEATAQALGMDVLVEVHDAIELERALHLSSTLIGINNRNLKTLDVDLGLTEKLAAKVGNGRMVVSESGLYTPRDLKRMAGVGAKCFLIGESLMRENDVTAATRAILKKD